MPKLKLTKDEFNPDELDVEYDDSTFVNYTGEIPKTGTILMARATKAWWTYAADETPMLKVLSVVEQGENGTEEFDGLPIWDNLPFKPSAAFKYGPWLDVNGLTLNDVFKSTFVADTDDNIGAPIEKIADWEPDTDDALYQVVIKRERYDDEWAARASQYLPLEDPEDDEDEEDDEDLEDEEEDIEEDEEEEDVEEEEPEEPPTRGRRSRAASASAPAAPATRSRTAAARDSKSPPASTAKAAAKPASGRAAKPASKPAAPARGTRTRAAASKPAPAATGARKGRRAASVPDDNEPPF